MKTSRSTTATRAGYGLLFCLMLQANNSQAAIINFTSLIDPSPDILLPSPSYTYEHSLTSVGFNPATDTLTSAELHVYFAEEDWVAQTDDSVTIYFEGSAAAAGVSSDPAGIGNSTWDDIFSVDVSLLQTDGTLSIRLDSAGGTLFRMSELTATGTSVVPVPAAAWLFTSGLLGLIGVARRKKS